MRAARGSLLLSTLLPMLSGCIKEAPEATPVVYDSLGLPDCFASFRVDLLCDPLKAPLTGARWAAPKEFKVEAAWADVPLTWVGTTPDPSEPWDCASSAEEALEVALAHDAELGEAPAVTEVTTGYTVLSTDGTRAVRVGHCEVFSWLGPTPPEETGSAAVYAVPARDTFASFTHEVEYQRQRTHAADVMLAFGDAETESLHFRSCNLHCIECGEDGGPTYHLTAVLAQHDWDVSPDGGTVTYMQTADDVTECSITY